MKKALLGAVAAVALGALAMPAVAAPIAVGSTIQLSNGQGGTGGATIGSNSVTFTPPINIDSTMGSFMALGMSCTGCVTLSTISYSGTAVTAPYLPNTVFSATNNGATATFGYSPGATITQGTGFFVVSGSGIATLSGFEATAGTLVITAQTNGGVTNVSFSATVASGATAVPEPASLALFGAGLVGLGLVGRRRRAG